jgi:hypothetical protein
VLTPLGCNNIKVLDMAAPTTRPAAAAAYTRAGEGRPFTVPAWKKALTPTTRSRSPSQRSAAVDDPGRNDEQIPDLDAVRLARRPTLAIGHSGCNVWVYPGRSHAGVIRPSSGDNVQWITDRFAGRAANRIRTPTGIAGTSVSRRPERRPAPSSKALTT